MSTDELRTRAQAAAPELVITQMYLPGSYYGNVAVAHGEERAVLVRDRANAVMIDASSGATVLTRMAQDLGWPARWIDTADPLHFGDFGGVISKTIWFIFGLLLSGLTLTGAYLHERRQRRQRREQYRRTGVLVAYLVSVLALIAATFGAVQEFPMYAPVPPAPATWWFIGLWIASTVAILTVWMCKLK